MSRLDNPNNCYVYEAKQGIIYTGAGGEMQKDAKGQWWHKSYYDGLVRPINPDASAIITIVKEVEK